MVNNKVEQYLIDLKFTYQQIDSNLWLLNDEEHSLPGVAVILTEPLTIIRAEIMDIPNNNLQELYETLLKLNATDVILGAYAVENGKVILIDSLLYDTMNYEDFRASLDSISLALTQHYPILSKYREKQGG